MSNKKIQYTEEQVSQAMEGLPALWILKYKMKQESGMPISFEKWRFQWDMYNDLSPNQVTLKPPQVGETVKNLLKSFYVAKKLRRDIIYTLPTQGDVNDMAGGKINRIIAQNPILKEWIKNHDTVEQKQVGNNIIYYRGTFTTKAAMMVSSGLNIHDEVDASDPQVITQYETRLQAQEDGGWRWYFSHPSLVNHGVDIYWQLSDQKEWNITCKGCAKEQVLTWPDSIDIEKGIYICKHCKEELSNENRTSGRWVNKDGIPWEGKIVGGYKFSGWHISQLMLYNKSAKEILEAFNDPQKDKQYFYNYVLGLPYIGSEDRIDPSVVLRNVVDVVNPMEERTIIGADTGHGIHYVMLNKDGIFYYDHATEITASRDPYDVIKGHLKQYPRSIAVFDQGGDLIGVRKLHKEYPGRVFLCFYRRDRKTMDMVKWGEGDETGKVTVDRNRMLTLISEQMRETGRFRLNGTTEDWKEFASHFGNLYREKVETREVREKDNKSLYGDSFVWKRNGPDHFAHALLYALVGLQRYGGERATVVSDSLIDSLPKGKMGAEQIEYSAVAYLSPGSVANDKYEL